MAVAVGRRGRRYPRVWSAASLVAAVLSATVLSACSTSGGGAPAATTAAPALAAVPLTDSSATSAGTWATVAMGHLNDRLNTFWQMFHLAAGSTHWTLKTPPGVATSGGLISSTGPSGSFTVGFGPSTFLHFSPLTQSTDQGATWPARGILPGALALGPDSLATSSDHRYLALLTRSGGEVVASGGDLSTWTKVAGAGSVAATPSLSGCGIEGLTAVAFQSNREEIIGGSCGRGSAAGVFALRGGTWQSVGPSLPASAPGPTRVIRLLGTPTGATALISAGSGASGQLFAAQSVDGLSSWSVSAPLPQSGGTLVSTSVTAAGTFAAVTKSPSGALSAAVTNSSGTTWQPLPPLPARTVVVATDPGGTSYAVIEAPDIVQFDALGAAGWGQVQTLNVSIPYGSSG